MHALCLTPNHFHLVVETPRLFRVTVIKGDFCVLVQETGGVVFTLIGEGDIVMPGAGQRSEDLN